MLHQNGYYKLVIHIEFGQVFMGVDMKTWPEFINCEPLNNWLVCECCVQNEMLYQDAIVFILKKK